MRELFLLLLATSITVHGVTNEVCVNQDNGNSISHIKGSQSPRGERRWVVLLWVNCDLRLTTCEGSLVSEDWVLTSASCLPCGSNASVVIDVGLYHSDIRHEMIQNRPVARIGANKILLHPQYNKEQQRHDLALLHLNAPVNVSFIVQPVDCSDTKHNRESSQSFLSSGWGRSWMYSSLEVKPLHDVHLYMWSKEKCKGVLGRTTNGAKREEGEDFLKGMFCAGVKLSSISLNNSEEVNSNGNVLFPGMQESCFVSRGSGLVMQSPRIFTTPEGSVRISCEWRLFGVLSYGLTCGMNGLPGYYTDVCHYHKWLLDTMKEEKERLMNLRGCPAPPPPPVNGYICGLDNDEDTASSGRVQFCCERGYRPKGSHTLTCNRQERRWLPVGGATCEPVTCPPLPVPVHGLSHPPYCQNSTYTMTCWFSCHSGYQLSGHGLLTCQEDGTWSDLPPNCQPINCGPPPAGGNLLVEYTLTTYNSIALYTCKNCHRLNSVNTSLTRQCGDNGHWSGPLPVCQMVHCPVLSSPKYGHVVQSSTTCGSQARFHCIEGFVLLGASVTVCLATGGWSQSTPYCVSSNCPMPIVEDSVNFLPPTPDNPPRRNYTYGDVINIECQKCRRPTSGSTQLTCTQQGRWNGVPARCEWVTCVLPKLLQSGQIFPLGNVYFCGTLVRFRCYRGYRLVGMSSTYCSQNGTWTQPFPTCKSLHPHKECPQIHLSNGFVSVTHTGPRGVANMSCDSCYEMRGPSILRCMDGGYWDQPLPTCQRKLCPSLSSPPNGIIHQEVGHGRRCGDVAFFDCNRGYTREGPLAITCLPGGRWSRQPPTCQAVMCPPPPQPGSNSKICSFSDSGRIIDNIDDGSGYGPLITPGYLPPPEENLFPVGSSVQYCCVSGSMLMTGEGRNEESNQSVTLTCLSTGQWSRPPPKCSVYCELGSPLPVGLQVTSGRRRYPVGSSARFSCSSSHVLIGDRRLLCMQDGKWDSPLPHCISSSCYRFCSPPPVPQNGRLVSTNNNSYSLIGGISEGSVAIYICNRGYYIHGSVIRRCTGTGQWSGETTICLRSLFPRSKFILRHPVTKLWMTTDSWHFTVSQSVYLACQSSTGNVHPITKVSGPKIDEMNVRVSHFSVANRSHELLLQPVNREGARSITGEYQCHVSARNNPSHYIDRSIYIQVNDHSCPYPSPVVNGNLIVSGTTPGSCYTTNCRYGYRLHGNRYRTCQLNGEWSGSGSPQCVTA